MLSQICECMCAHACADKVCICAGVGCLCAARGVGLWAWAVVCVRASIIAGKLVCTRVSQWYNGEYEYKKMKKEKTTVTGIPLFT